jgi:hypothetical protein
MTVRYGKIGVIGQTLAKEFASPKDATAEVEKAIEKKLKEGYEEVDHQKGIGGSRSFTKSKEDNKSSSIKIEVKKSKVNEVVKSNKIRLTFPMRELHVMDIKESDYKRYLKKGISEKIWRQKIYPDLANRQSYYSAVLYDDYVCELWINDSFISNFKDDFKKLYIKSEKYIKNPKRPDYFALAYPTSYKGGDFTLNIVENFDFQKIKIEMEKVFTFEGIEDYLTIFNLYYGDEKFEYGDTEDPSGEEVFLYNPNGEINRISVQSEDED